MTTIAGNIAIIQTKAAELDELVAQFRAARAVIDAAEAAIRKAQQYPVALAHQERLATVALDEKGGWRNPWPARRMVSRYRAMTIAARR